MMNDRKWATFEVKLQYWQVKMVKYNKNLPLLLEKLDSSEVSKADNQLIQKKMAGDKETSFSSVTNGIVLSFHNITVHAKQKGNFFSNSKPRTEPKCILNDVSGVVKPEELLAVIGASGVGKTTLMNVLTNRNLQTLDVTGDVKLNGNIVGDALMYHSAYVQQVDMLHSFLTVREHLIFQAMLRMDSTVSYKKRMDHVENVIMELSLKKCSDTEIGILGSVVGISGGERKRLSLAIELLSNPSIMVCDEPTSGLDSYIALNVALELKKLCQSGRTVICVIHQPSSAVFEVIDKVLLMAEGRVAYMGSKEGALNFFESMAMSCPVDHNPGDFFIYNLSIFPDKRQDCKDKINVICDTFNRCRSLYENSTDSPAIQNSQVMDLPEVSRYKALWTTQLRMLTWRAFLEIRRGSSVKFGEFFMNILLSLMLGLLYYNQKLDQAGINNINGFLFMLLLQTNHKTWLAAIARFCSALPVFLREHRNGMYRIDTYFLSRVIVDLPFIIAKCIVYVTLTYHVVGCNPEFPAFWICLLVVCLASLGAASFGYMLSCLFDSLSWAMNIGPLLFALMFLFGGYFLINNSAPGFIAWIKYLSFYYYANEIMIVNQWKSIYNISCGSDDVSCIYDGKGVIEFLSFDENAFYQDIIGLLVLIFLYGILALVILMVNTFKYEKLPLIVPKLKSIKIAKEEFQLTKELKTRPFQFTGEGITVSFHNITVSVRKKRKLSADTNERPKYILKNVSGVVKPGNFFAVMGASGAGKTTLMNVLTHRNLQSLDVKGVVKLNGHTVEDTLMDYCAYVQQADLLHSFLTVREHLIFQAMLKMDANLSYENRMERVENTIIELNLQSCADRKLGHPGSFDGISGGERKKLCFAIEVLTNPLIMYCDEPTSELDCYASMSVITELQKLCRSGRTIMCTIHQPSSDVFKMFDNILLIAEGRIAYMGSKHGALDFFEKMDMIPPVNFNPADFFIYNLAIIKEEEQKCKDRINIICNTFEQCKSNYGNSTELYQDCEPALDLPEVSRYKASWITQLRFLTWRFFLEIRREFKLNLMTLIMSIIHSIILAMLYYNQKLSQEGIANINGCLFMILLNSTFRVMIIGAIRYCEVLPIFLREHRNGMYRADTYFIGISISDLPMTFALCVVRAVIIYYPVGFNTEFPAFWIFAVTILLCINVALSYGYLISCISGSVPWALVFKPTFTLPLMVFGGVLINNISVSKFLSWIKYLSPLYYCNEILMINQWKNIRHIACERNVSCLHNGIEVIKSLSFDEEALCQDIICLISLFFGIRILAFVAFYLRTRKTS